MTFKELLSRVSFKDAMNGMLKYWNDQDRFYDGYERVYNSLLSLEPKHDDLVLCCSLISADDDDQVSLDVYGLDIETNQYYGLEFSPWEEWLGMTICLNPDITEAEFVGGCLWEMTFYGFDQATIKKESDHLEAVVNELKLKKLEDLEICLDVPSGEGSGLQNH